MLNIQTLWRSTLLCVLPLALSLTSCQKPADKQADAPETGKTTASKPAGGDATADMTAAKESSDEAAAKAKPEVMPEPPVKSDADMVAASTKPSHVDAKGAKALLDKDAGVIVLDIRTPAEYAAGHIKNGQLVDFFGKDFKTKIGDLDRSKTYLVHCRSGGRSGKSLALFEKLGFQHVVHMDGGFNDWTTAGFPVEK